jgi:hypothetical protein
MFRKPSLADIYVKELRTRLDQSMVPLFPPDAADIRVGTIGRFTDGAFDRRGHLDEVLGGADAFAEKVPPADPTQPGSLWFRSEGSVHLEPAGTVTAMGKELLKAKLSFTGDRSVVASFAGVVEHAVSSPRMFDDLLWKLYIEGDLKPDEVVVWLHREAASGTVLVNRKGGVDVELTVDPDLVGGIVSFEGLGAGVTFGSGSSASSQISNTDLTVCVKVKGLSGDEAVRIVDRRGFEPSTDAILGDYLGSDVPEITPDEVIGEADFDEPE